MKETFTDIGNTQCSRFVFILFGLCLSEVNLTSMEDTKKETNAEEEGEKNPGEEEEEQPGEKEEKPEMEDDTEKKDDEEPKPKKQEKAPKTGKPPKTPPKSPAPVFKRPASASTLKRPASASTTTVPASPKAKAKASVASPKKVEPVESKSPAKKLDVKKTKTKQSDKEKKEKTEKKQPEKKDKKGSANKKKSDKKEKKEKVEKKSKKAEMLEAFTVKEEEKEENEEEGEEEDKEEDPDYTETEARDRSKSNRFFTMLNTGGLPEAVLSAWQSAGTRKKQTEIINGLFLKKGGKLVIDQSFMMPTTYQKDRTTERVDSAKDSQSGFGRLIFCRQNNLSPDDLDECVRNGEVRKFKSGDIWLYSAVNVQVESEVRKSTKEMLGGNSVDLTEEAATAFTAVFDRMVPEVNLPQVAALPSSSSAPGQISDVRSQQSLETI